MTVAADSPGEVRLLWNAKQARFLECTDTYQNLEGGVRAGKSYVLCWKAFQYCVRYPGICIALTRYTDDGLKAILKPVWRAVLEAAGVVADWRADEECDVLPNGSRVYLRALHTSDDQRRYSKLAGLTLSVLAIDQAEELPEDIYRHYVPARLSQPGFPKEVWITPNPPMPNSWIAKDWPDGLETGTVTKPGFVLIRTTMYDNADVLGQSYINMNQAAYEPGSLEYRRLVEGKRGLIVAGTPIYARHFTAKHVRSDLTVDRTLPLYQAVDFGTKHPCCVWLQFPPGGRCHVLGGLMGDDLGLEEFLPLVQDWQRRWFGDVPIVQATCDPAGQARNSHGTKTGVQIMQEWGIYPQVEADANHPPQRHYAIQTVIGYLRRTTADHVPLFLLNPQFAIVGVRETRVEAVLQYVFEGGYVYDPKRTYSGTTYPHIVPPMKDGWFEHPANALEYGVLAFGPRDPAAAAGLARNPAEERRARQLLQAHGRDDGEKSVLALQRDIAQARIEHERAKLANRALRLAQRDPDEPFRWGARGVRAGGRGGY